MKYAKSNHNNKLLSNYCHIRTRSRLHRNIGEYMLFYHYDNNEVIEKLTRETLTLYSLQTCLRTVYNAYDDAVPMLCKITYSLYRRTMKSIMSYYLSR